jgi:ADP-ribosylglycohydrolase
MTKNEKIINGLLGLAVCDAIGNPFEFKTNIDRVDVIEYANSATSLIVSDDTQMTIFGFEANYNRNCFSGSKKHRVKQSYNQSYLDWYMTQTEPYDNFLEEFPSTQKTLLDFREMYSIQAPGDTCLSSLKRIKNGLEPRNDSMGCGSVMRLLPLMLLGNTPPDYNSLYEIIEFGKITGRITHQHLTNDKAITDYLVAAYSVMVEPYAQLDVVPKKASHVSDLGDGWIAPECVDMAIWCYSVSNTFEELLGHSIAHDGDSDSVGAIAGSLWGLSGKEVPQKYIDKLDALEPIKYVIENYINNGTV